MADRLPEIKQQIEKHFFKDGAQTPYWISFDIDGLDKNDFASTGTAEDKGITLDFILKFLEVFVP